MMRTEVVDAMIASAPRAQYPRGDECKEAITQVGNGMTIVSGWIQTMTDDELEHLGNTLRRSLDVVEREKARRDGR